MSTWQTSTFEVLNRDLAGVLGKKTADELAKLRVHTIGDLLRDVPRRYVTGSDLTDLGEFRIGDDVAVLGKVHSRVIPGFGDDQLPGLRGSVLQQRARLVVIVETRGGGRLECAFFGRLSFVRGWYKHLVPGRKGIFVGRLGSFNGQLQLSHPDFVVWNEQGELVERGATREAKANRSAMAKLVQTDSLIGLYGGTKALPTWRVAECVDLVEGELAGELSDYLPEWVLREDALPGLLEAFRLAHHPATLDDAELGAYRLRYDEALALQLTMARRRADLAKQGAPVLAAVAGGILGAFDAGLPFTLTAGQETVGAEVFADLERGVPMQRLLQGEVGSGKTLVAARAMLRAVDAGYQAALVAPTEVLAQQHFRTFKELLGDLGEGPLLGGSESATSVVLLTGSTPAKERRATGAAIASGEAGIVIGTHALFSGSVDFADLGLVVIDEQHRFGVEQRAVLLDRARRRPHVLVMTATPIPRSVAMSTFGDLTVSTLTEIPAGRSDVQTTVVDMSRNAAWLGRAWQRVREEVQAGRQVFVVCPRIGADDADEVAATEEQLPPSATVEEVFERVSQRELSGLRVGVVHGRLAASERTATMAAFAAGELDVLVATTVIEVGVDVPNASMMLILDADRFGISQLHQLRGRIGRGEHPGLCLLTTFSPSGSTTRERLDAVAATRDGFALAEVDLEQRREGDVLGAAQSGGRSSLRLIRVLEHRDLLERTREVAERLVAGDPDEHDPYLADLVAQFERQAAGDFIEKS